jgi:hypothetical protein
VDRFVSCSLREDRNMYKRIRTGAFLVLALAAVVWAGPVWGEDGHRIVARTAEAHVSANVEVVRGSSSGPASGWRRSSTTPSSERGPLRPSRPGDPAP